MALGAPKEQTCAGSPTPQGSRASGSSPGGAGGDPGRQQDKLGLQTAFEPPAAAVAGATPTAAGGGGEAQAAGAPTPSPLSLPVKGRSSDKLDSCDAASVASSQKHSTRSAYSNASSIGSEFINDQIPAHQREVARIQSQMKAFVKGMVKGRDMSVLSVDGQVRSCTCSFDRKLKNYNILISKETRSIPLAKFREVFQGTEPEDIATPLDQLCCTFVLDNGECLTFRFKDVPEREQFAVCLQMIVDAHQ